MTSPTRITVYPRRRKAAAGTLNVTRIGRYGNPFLVDEHGQDKAVRLHAAWLVGAGPDSYPNGKRKFHLSRSWVLANLAPVATAPYVGCTCDPDEPCHADTLIRLATREVA
ncbi:hypothetical protein BBK14_07995 [Parafrankia soli]|uniref:DUF4326 domain-containing protein n=1 Tax=Parafrankia soli TaxID=2599596 RepID=A0A1S1PE59_9ACTN|nr:DUF4326 domain-containing protein [Parafrankia soli]OHV21208.1 hypothetical protein BBK14_07995 [Parafrankia soli]